MDNIDLILIDINNSTHITPDVSYCKALTLFPRVSFL